MLYMDLSITQKVRHSWEIEAAPMSGTRYFLIFHSWVGDLLYIRSQQMEDCPFDFNCLLLFLLLSTWPWSSSPTSTVSFVAYYSVNTRECVVAGLYQLLGANCLCPFPTPHSVTLHWEPEIGHGGSICTMKISKCYKSGLFPPESYLFNIPQHTTEFTSSYFRKHIKQMKKILTIRGEELTVCIYLPCPLSPLLNHGKQQPKRV